MKTERSKISIHVVVECGVNWNTVDEALLMIEEAKKANSNYVKFQVFNKEIIANSPLRERLEKLILTEEGVKYLKAKADAVEIGFILTPMYLEAVDIAAKYADLIKIRFKDHENQQLIDKALETGKTLLISVPYRPIGQYMYHPRIKWMYCVSRNGVALYPPEPEDFNLDAVACCDGFSSHYPYTILDLAYAINRFSEEAYIEKHVMLAHRGKGGENTFDYYIPTGEVEGSVMSPWKGAESSEIPIDANVSIEFSELEIFISNLHLIERIKRTRI